MQKITPFLWFNGNAQEAVNFYVSIFKNSKVGTITRCGEGGPGPKGSVLTANFTLEGQEFIALNGGPMFTFSPAISFFVNCVKQEDVDELWDKLSAGGEKQQCGWLKDKFGVSWQIIPTVLMQLLGEMDPVKAKNAFQAMRQMSKIDIARLRQAIAPQ